MICVICIHTAVYDVAQSRDVAMIKGAVGNVMVPEFVPQRGVKIQVDIYIYTYVHTLTHTHIHMYIC